MKVNYNLAGKTYNFNIEKNKELFKLNTLLSNDNGDFLNLGLERNSCKYHGLSISNQKYDEFFKFIDEILIENHDVESVEVMPHKIIRTYSSKFSKNITSPVFSDTKIDGKLAESDISDYNEKGVLKEISNEKVSSSTRDSFYLGPTGGIVYEIFDYDGYISIDLDMRKFNDFDKWGREYNVYEKDGIVFVKYSKKDSDSNKEYGQYLGIKSPNLLYELKEEWIEKKYEYSKARKSLYEFYIFRLMKIKVLGDKRIVFGTGFSEKEVILQIELLEKHQNELEGIEEEFVKENFVTEESFEKPIPQEIFAAYNISRNSLYKFLKKNGNSNSDGVFAGFPWFSQVWTRDELIGLKGFFRLGELNLTRDKFLDYFKRISNKNPSLKRISTPGSLDSLDGNFWLLKRFLDFVFMVNEKGELEKFFSESELKLIYEKCNIVFAFAIENYWDKENELLKVKKGDSWMDTIEVQFPLDMQVLFLEYSYSMAVLAGMLGREEDAKKFLDLENLLREKIRSAYWRNGILYSEPFYDRQDCNVFLAYYLYPDLFLHEDWIKIIDNSLSVLRTHWGGISSLSKKDPIFHENYSGENDASYHNGDSWYFINNITAMVLEDLDEKKYRNDISKILLSSTRDILKMGTLGFASEISSASDQKAEGSMAQLWSVSTYIEMVEKLFMKR